jgi:hypothetical protein
MLYLDDDDVDDVAVWGIGAGLIDSVRYPLLIMSNLVVTSGNRVQGHKPLSNHGTARHCHYRPLRGNREMNIKEIERTPLDYLNIHTVLLAYTHNFT